MFRRLVSNLAFSPALVGQLGFYAKRLRQEETTRRIGLVFTALALVVQSLAVFSPPEAANAASPGQVGGSSRCSVTAVGPRSSAFTVKDGVATVSFDVKGSKNCKVQLSANSYFAPSMDGRPWSKQTLHDRQTKVYDTPGRYTLKTDLPNRSNQNKGCFYQVDLTYGTHNVLPVLAYGHGKLNCSSAPTPMAACSSLSVIQATDKTFSFNSRASTSGNATIRSYTYTVKNSAGVVVLTKQVASTSTSNQLQYAQSLPGTYSAQVTVNTSVGPQTNENCKKNFVVTATPVASCVGVGVIITDRTQVYFKGTAKVAGGASIKSYTFVVKNSSGVEVKRLTVNTNDSTAATTATTLSASGTYTVQLTVATSLGDKTGPGCTKQFIITPPAVCQYNPSLPKNSPDCQPCPDNPEVWVKDKECTSVIVNTKTSANLSQGSVDASTVTAKASDKISYTITLENKGLISEKVTMQEELNDVLEYATLVDQGGAQFDANQKLLIWPEVTLAAGQKQSRTFAVQTMNNIPSTNTGTGTPSSYDCTMVNTYGNTITIKVDCPPQKVVVEQIVSELPATGPRENMIFAGIVLAIVVYFYARSRQLGTEVRLIRRNLNTGTV